MEQPREKFGSVYVTSLDENGKDISSPSKLAGVYFSNWDHQWYDNNTDKRKIYPKMAEHAGKTFHLEMRIKTRNPKTGQEGFYTGRLLVPFKVLEFPIPDMKSIPEENLSVMKFLKKLGIIDEIDDLKATRFSKMHAAALACFIAPGWKLQEFRGLSRFFQLVAFFDDVLEQNKLYKYSEFIILRNAIHETMNGKDVNWAEEQLKIRKFEEENQMNFFEKILNYMRNQRQLINEKCLGTDLDSRFLVERYMQWFDAMMLECCCEWMEKKNEDASLNNMIHGEIQRVTISTHVGIEFLMLEKGINLDPEVRNTLLVSKFYDVIAEQARKINDIFSFYKEAIEGETGGVIHLLQGRDGLTQEEALQKTIDIANRKTKEVCKIGTLLLKMYEGNKQVASLVETGKSVMYGHMKWYSYTRRYQADLVCDCVVEMI